MIATTIIVGFATTALYLWWTRRFSAEGVSAGVLAIILAAQLEYAVLTLIRVERNPTFWTYFPFFAVVIPLIEETARFTAVKLMSGARGLFTSLVSVSLGMSVTEVFYKLRDYADPDLASLEGLARFAGSGFSSGLLHLLVALVVARRVESISLWLSMLTALGLHASYKATIDVAFNVLQTRGMDPERLLGPFVISALLALIATLIVLSRRHCSPARQRLV